MEGLAPAEGGPAAAKAGARLKARPVARVVLRDGRGDVGSVVMERL
jgi:hypothetical protein